MGSKKTAVIAGIFLFLIAVAAGVIWQWSRNLLVVDNTSGKTLSQITITVCGEKYHLADIAPGNSKTLAFKVNGDSGFKVDVVFEDRTTQSTTFGYVTGGPKGYHNRVTVRVGPEGIEGKQVY
ncbi:MAG: hypothetical protein ABSE63_16565 [Thermoguttaceae bacterium]|jgi:hypothetical protein